jgi:hypothetical protein
MAIRIELLKPCVDELGVRHEVGEVLTVDDDADAAELIAARAGKLVDFVGDIARADLAWRRKHQRNRSTEALS